MVLWKHEGNYRNAKSAELSSPYRRKFIMIENYIVGIPMNRQLIHRYYPSDWCRTLHRRLGYSSLCVCARWTRFSTGLPGETKPVNWDMFICLAFATFIRASKCTSRIVVNEFKRWKSIKITTKCEQKLRTRFVHLALLVINYYY